METEIKIPKCVGIIMDGNRRWAKSKNLPTLAGHSMGREKLKEFLSFAKEAGVKHVIAFAFSSENWNRSPEEVSYILDLMLKAFREDKDEFLKQKAKIKFAGDLSRFSEELRNSMVELENETKNFGDVSLTLCVSYGGRDEIIHSFNKIIEKGIKKITGKDISDNLYTNDIPDPDLIIRTSGEMRLSGFLIWQSIYSELFFTDTLWPDFSKEEFLKILEQYGQRQRRFGK